MKSEQSARRVSSTTIGHLRNRSRSGWLCTVCVNSGGQRSVHLARNHHQSTRTNGLKVRVMLPICQFICSCCLFSAQRNQPETRAFCREFTPLESEKWPSFAILFVKKSSVLTLRAKCSLFTSKAAHSSCLLPGTSLAKQQLTHFWKCPRTWLFGTREGFAHKKVHSWARVCSALKKTTPRASWGNTRATLHSRVWHRNR